jgi:anti-sigma factor RsiW
MGDIVQLHGDPHQQVQQLLPWFVNGTLEAAECRLVEEHIAACTECATDLAHERRFANAYVSLAAPTTNGWTALKERAVAAQATRREGRWHQFTSRYGRFAAIAASQLLLVTASVAAYRFLSEQEQPVYHVLGAEGTTLPPEGNMVVIFRPDVTEQAMRTTLLAARARIVNGPTKASGYVLAVAPTERTHALDLLRARSEILLAQPIDGASLP